MGGAHIPYGRDGKFTQNFSGKTEGKRPVGKTVRDETIIPRGFIEKLHVSSLLDSSGLRECPLAEFCKDSNEPTISI